MWGGGCPRIQRFYSIGIKYNGKDTGNAKNDCSRNFNEVKATVASYYEAIPDCMADYDCDYANECTFKAPLFWNNCSKSIAAGRV